MIVIGFRCVWQLLIYFTFAGFRRLLTVTNILNICRIPDAGIWQVLYSHMRQESGKCKIIIVIVIRFRNPAYSCMDVYGLYGASTYVMVRIMCIFYEIFSPPGR